ncbi:hypothetical protein GLYMA_20G127900v4 [Glycine max]|uniref:Uncharacterized protein n=1 Tax=Glycine max TaxID=3847 RepID=K7N363_SOYBN|nr:hypothetical protein GYH30_055684 [Glycine max]KRG91014.1 hypothetical protein GLYMA_20G127900v4 [Glycine max]
MCSYHESECASLQLYLILLITKLSVCKLKHEIIKYYHACTYVFHMPLLSVIEMLHCHILGIGKVIKDSRVKCPN